MVIEIESIHVHRTFTVGHAVSLGLTWHTILCHYISQSFLSLFFIFKVSHMLEFKRTSDLFPFSRGN